MLNPVIACPKTETLCNYRIPEEQEHVKVKMTKLPSLMELCILCPGWLQFTQCCISVNHHVYAQITGRYAKHEETCMQNVKVIIHFCLYQILCR